MVNDTNAEAFYWRDISILCCVLSVLKFGCLYNAILCFGKNIWSNYIKMATYVEKPLPITELGWFVGVLINRWLNILLNAVFNPTSETNSTRSFFVTKPLAWLVKLSIGS